MFSQARAAQQKSGGLGELIPDSLARSLSSAWSAVSSGVSASAPPIQNVSVKQLQTALNGAYSPSGTRLTVDGLFGSKTRARLIEYQQSIGLTANGNPNDYTTLVSLGFNPPGLPGATVTGSVARTPVTPVTTQAGQTILKLGQPQSGDFIDTTAAALNVSRSTAQILLIGGGGLVIVGILAAMKK